MAQYGHKKQPAKGLHKPEPIIPEPIIFTDKMPPLFLAAQAAEEQLQTARQYLAKAMKQRKDLENVQELQAAADELLEVLYRLQWIRENLGEQREDKFEFFIRAL